MSVTEYHLSRLTCPDNKRSMTITIRSLPQPCLKLLTNLVSWEPFINSQPYHLASREPFINRNRTSFTFFFEDIYLILPSPILYRTLPGLKPEPRPRGFPSNLKSSTKVILYETIFSHINNIRCFFKT